MNTYENVDGFLRRTKQEDAPAPQVNDFKLEFLLTQKAAIEAQKAEQVAARDRELAEIDEMITECGKLGIVAQPIVEEA
jgi:hypothetical protein